MWQFHRRDGLNEVKPSPPPVFRAQRRFDRWTVAVLLHTPTPELDGATPLDWIASGADPQPVVSLVDEWAADSRELQATQPAPPPVPPAAKYPDIRPQQFVAGTCPTPAVAEDAFIRLLGEM